VNFTLGLVLFGGSMAGLGFLAALWLTLEPWWLGGAEEA